MRKALCKVEGWSVRILVEEEGWESKRTGGCVDEGRVQLQVMTSAMANFYRKLQGMVVTKDKM